VYAIPVVFVVGWRGEPNIKDEPQHIYQGKVTLKILDEMNISYFVVSKETTVDELQKKMYKFNKLLKIGKSVAFVIKKDALMYNKRIEYKNENLMKREDIIKYILKYSKTDPIISTTGKTSRELFEIRNMNKQEHKYDFLTVGSMGHCSSIALSIAINKPNTKVWCIEGDGSALMHLGAMAVIGANNPKNLVHIVINNFSHESVGGMPTVAKDISFTKIAYGCGYKKIIRISSVKNIDKKLKQAMNSKELTFVEILSAIGSRPNLGRPTLSAIENKKNFMRYINSLK
jgi:phosphonopyruvate decarboxylase